MLEITKLQNISAELNTDLVEAEDVDIECINKRIGFKTVISKCSIGKCVREVVKLKFFNAYKTRDLIDVVHMYFCNDNVFIRLYIIGYCGYVLYDDNDGEVYRFSWLFIFDNELKDIVNSIYNYTSDELSKIVRTRLINKEYTVDMTEHDIVII